MYHAILGGTLIGLAVSMLLYFNGKISGVSGILAGVFNPEVPDKKWRLEFIGGLLTGGLLLKGIHSEAFEISSAAQSMDYLIGGFLVGFGTLLGNGCTSGHGVCGISRFSGRSIVATMTFIIFGMISVIVFRFLRGEI